MKDVILIFFLALLLCAWINLIAKRTKGKKGSQKGRILRALLLGPKTTLELSRITAKYTQRVSDLRVDKWDIIAHKSTDHSGWIYRLGAIR